MEQEIFATGYCRMLDGSRTVEILITDGELTEVDCCYGSCIHESVCQIGQKIRDALTNPGKEL